MNPADGRSHIEAEHIGEFTELHDGDSLLSCFDGTDVRLRPVHLRRQFGLRQFGLLAPFPEEPPHSLMSRRRDIPAHSTRPQLILPAWRLWFTPLEQKILVNYQNFLFYMQQPIGNVDVLGWFRRAREVI